MNSIKVFFDLETTGYQGLDMLDENHRIIQFGAVSNIFKFEMNVNPGIAIDHRSTEIHNITTPMVVYAQSIDKVWNTFLKMVDQYDIVYMIAHECFFFDRLMLYKELLRMGITIDFKRFVFVDTKHIIRKMLVDEDSYSLKNLTTKYLPNYKYDNAHTALADCMAMYNLCETLYQFDYTNPILLDEIKILYELNKTNKTLLKKTFNNSINNIKKKFTEDEFEIFIKDLQPELNDLQVKMLKIRVYNDLSLIEIL